MWQRLRIFHQENDQLVSPQSPRYPLPWQGSAYHLTYQSQHGIPGGMTVPVIDLLEVIQVDQ